MIQIVGCGGNCPRTKMSGVRHASTGLDALVSGGRQSRPSVENELESEKSKAERPVLLTLSLDDPRVMSCIVRYWFVRTKRENIEGICAVFTAIRTRLGLNEFGL